MWLFVALSGFTSVLLPFVCLRRYLCTEDGALDSSLPVSLRQARAYVVLFLALIAVRIAVLSLTAHTGFYDIGLSPAAVADPEAAPDMYNAALTPYLCVLMVLPLPVWLLGLAALLLFGGTIFVRVIRGRCRPSSLAILSWFFIAFPLGCAAFWGVYVTVLSLSTGLIDNLRIFKFPF
jgi:hypothetical protein